MTAPSFTDEIVQDFFEKPILNSPYNHPEMHWELDNNGQPTNRILRDRRRSELITPVPKPRKQRHEQTELRLDATDGHSTDTQEYNPTPIINEVRSIVKNWRCLPNPNDWRVTPETARLLQHWRHHKFENFRPFFCQVEAVETAIWLAEVAPRFDKRGRKLLEHFKGANEQANPELYRIALKLCTGAGKTTVMAMLIAWHIVNATRHPNSKLYAKGFLIVTPGITIRDRLRVLLPNDPESYYKSREIIPRDMLGDIEKANIVITNYHSFKPRERIKNLAANTRKLLEGRGPKFQSLETEGEMLRRVMPGLQTMKNIIVINDEAHHCYRERPDPKEGGLKGDAKAEANKNNEAARLWITGLEKVKRNNGIRTVYDLSATPFFLQGSGYKEGTLFPWTASDFSLMDGIECGIVKLPRVPIADDVPGEVMPKFRNLWDHIGKKMPKKGRGKSAGNLDPLKIPTELQAALGALHAHYEKTFDLWSKSNIGVPPVFIIVCNNTSTSKLVYDYVSGFTETREDGSDVLKSNGQLKLFRNYDDYGNREPRPRTLLIDSEQLESGEAIDKGFREIAADEINSFRQEIITRTGDRHAADRITDEDLLREVMNTVGKQGKLGESIRCVVSVSMLTEGWDANTVTHILGVRAFGTQLLCEQVVGRALRRQSYELNDQNIFDAEYADIFGIPFDFTAKPVISSPVPPKNTTRVHAVRPDRDALEIVFPRITGYRVVLREERLSARFTQDSVLNLTPELVGPSITRNQGIVGEGLDLSPSALKDMRSLTVLYHLTKHLVENQYRAPGEEPKLHLFGQLKNICRQWMEGGYLQCSGQTTPAQLTYPEISDMACERIKAAISSTLVGKNPVRAIPDSYNPSDSTALVDFVTSKEMLHRTEKSHVNWVVCDSDWEAKFARTAEAHPKVIAYVKNHGLGFEVPYVMGGIKRKYIPDFIVRVDAGQGDILNLIVEIKGYRREDAKVKAETMRAYWVPGVNNLMRFGKWAFAEFKEVFEIENKFAEVIDNLSINKSA